jgi:hypothetical protein
VEQILTSSAEHVARMLQQFCGEHELAEMPALAAHVALATMCYANRLAEATLAGNAGMCRR